MLKLTDIVFIGNSHLDQFNLCLKSINYIYALGASIKGLVNSNSKMKLKEKISAHIQNHSNTILVFFLGQVDIEFGYYYKCVVDNIKYDINEYYDNLICIYESYLKTLNNKIYILSINPTTIIDQVHTFNVCFRGSNGSNGYYSEVNHNYAYENDIFTMLNDSYQQRFLNTAIFNVKLNAMCIKNGYKFIDLWDQIVENDKIKPKYMPTHNDHHLKNGDNQLIDYVLNQMDIE